MPFEPTRDKEKTLKEYLELEPENLSKQEICRRLKMSTSTLYKLLTEWSEAGLIKWPGTGHGGSVQGERKAGAGRPPLDRVQLLQKFLTLNQSWPHHKIATAMGINVMTFYRVMDDWKHKGWIATDPTGKYIPTDLFRVELSKLGKFTERPIAMTRNNMLDLLLKLKQLSDVIEEMLETQP